MKKLGFTLTTATLLMLKTIPSLAMDLNIKSLDDSDNTATTSSDNSAKSYTPPIDLGAYPSKISFILGYSRVTLQDAKPSNFSVVHGTNNLATFNDTPTNDSLNGIKLGATQFITQYWGYEVNLSYFLSKTNQANYSGVYAHEDLPPDTLVNGNASIENSLWTMEALAIGGLHLSTHWLVIGKLGLGYESLTQKTNLTATFPTNPVLPPFYTPSSTTSNDHGFGIAGGAALRYDFSHNFSFETGINDLAGKRNLLIYEADLLVKA
ncbi:MAG: hypothetical protein K5Q00_04470 [Gammaproteobacteria bacterium]|nr:hypothetical protein [Gammaproteobacteria bacterium]